MISPVTVRFLRYVLTGGTSAVVDLTVFTILHGFGGLGIPLAMTCSFCVAAVVNYVLTSLFVFAHAPSLRHLALFFVGAAAGWAVNLCVTLGANAFIPFARILAALSVGLGLPAALLSPYAATLARACGIAVAFLFNFYVNSTFVFRRAAPVARPRIVA